MVFRNLERISVLHVVHLRVQLKLQKKGEKMEKQGADSLWKKKRWKYVLKKYTKHE